MPRILLTNHYPDGPLDIICSLLPEGFDVLALEKPGRPEILRLAPEADYLLVGGRVSIDREVLAAAPRLRMIQRTGVGLDSLDLEAIHERGIPVYVNAGVNSRSVAEHTIHLIFAILRRLPIIDHSVKSGEWRKHELGTTCHDLFGKTVGLIGLGNIGLHVARMLQPFGVRLIHHKRSPLPADEESALGLTHVPFRELLETSDIISLHCPLNPETRNLLGQDEFRRMKPGVLLVNTARGGLIDQASLADHLRTGHIAAAGLDVFATEPPDPADPLLKLPNVVLTPHMGGLTIETFSVMMSAGINNIEKFHHGHTTEIEPSRLKHLPFEI